jgi:hypothetical protein
MEPDGMIREMGFAVAFLLCVASAVQAAEDAKLAGWSVGLARREITPTQPTWMSGYSGRDRPASTALHPLWAKAISLQDANNQTVVLVSLDLIGLSRPVWMDVANQCGNRHGLKVENMTFCCSHTHSGPVIAGNLAAAFALEPDQLARVSDYTETLKTTLVELVGDSLADLKPAELAFTNGRCTLAVNRRNNREPDVPALRAAGQLVGPVDHDVPVLTIRNPDRSMRAIVFGYACHSTVLSGYDWCGDYPGYACIELEKTYPEATALFFAGCGGDQNPLPRGTVELARSHGERLASDVIRAIEGVHEPLQPRLEAKRVETSISFASLPSKDELEATAASTNKFEAIRARLLLAEINAGRPLSPTYPYPITLWKLGGKVDWFFLGGEVTVDYALRLKEKHGRESTWVAAYTNDVMAYIPSQRVLREGGYEGGGAMVYYGLPGAWRDDVEEAILHASAKLAE